MGVSFGIIDAQHSAGIRRLGQGVVNLVGDFFFLPLGINDQLTGVI